MLAKRLIKSNDAGGGGACTNTVDLYNPFPDGGGVALYQLNGDATDVSGNYDGIATNVTWGGAGVFGTSVSFSGSTTPSLASRIVLNSYNNFLIGSKQTVTVSLWFKTTASSGAMFVDYAVQDINLLLRLNAGRVQITNRYSDNTTSITSDNTYNDNSWHNAVAVINVSSLTATLYIDGVFNKSSNISSAPYGGAGTSNAEVTLGALRFNPFTDPNLPDYYSEEYAGSIDQVRIFNRALRPYEVEALYTEEYCTPTIVPSEHFNTVLYTGNSSSQSVTGVGFQPDLVWIKSKNISGANHNIYDSVRGAGKTLFSNATLEEYTTSEMTGFSSDGFDFSGTAFDSNNVGNDLVAWTWKAGGAAVTNTDGTITSQVSANTEAGFSIVSCTPTGGVDTIGHGLGVAPSVIIYKTRSTTGNWATYHQSLGNTKGLYLNTTSAAVTSSFFWNNTSPTSSVFTAYGSGGNTQIAYCFAEVEGFSNFGSYVGTGASGNTIVTGFEPAFVMIKRTNGTSDWNMWDNKRGNQSIVWANGSNAEATNAAYEVQFYENGFVINATGNFANGNGDSYIYMAFAADPTTIEPSLEDSFNTVTWTGDSVQGRSISGVGFAPDFTWIKKRTGLSYNSLFDTVRGAGNKLVSNETLAEYGNTYGGISVFESDGFAVNSLGVTDLGDVNLSPNTYVAWNWKAAELPAINSNGSIPSVVSANPAAGFSIVSYTGNGANATIGHGLGVAPSVYIVKNRDAAIDWAFETTLIDGSLDYLFLNSAVAKGDAGEAVPNETIFNIDGSIYQGANNNKFIAYCFAEVAGFSKFGSYTGTGSAGNTVTVGFEPAFLLIKRTDVSGNSWIIGDNKRDTTNPIELFLAADTTQAEFPLTNGIDFNANDFTLDSTNGSVNASGGTYIYMAFANQF